MSRMANAASQQAFEIGKERLREMLENSDTGRQAMAMSARQGNRSREDDGISMDTLNGDGKKKREEDVDLDDI
jgi:protein SEY1